jgi:hypothetical protein
MPPGRSRARCADTSRAAPSAAGSHRWRRPPGAPRAAHTPRTERALLAGGRATAGTAALARHSGLGGRQGQRRPVADGPAQRLIGACGRTCGRTCGRSGAEGPRVPGSPQQLQLARSPRVADEVKGNGLSRCGHRCGHRCGQWHVVRSRRRADLAAAPERSVPPSVPPQAARSPVASSPRLRVLQRQMVRRRRSRSAPPIRPTQSFFAQVWFGHKVVLSSPRLLAAFDCLVAELSPS